MKGEIGDVLVNDVGDCVVMDCFEFVRRYCGREEDER